MPFYSGTFPTAPLRTGRTPFSVSGSPKVPTRVLDGPNNNRHTTSYDNAFAVPLRSVALQPEFGLSVGRSVNALLRLSTLLIGSSIPVLTTRQYINEQDSCCWLREQLNANSL